MSNSSSIPIDATIDAPIIHVTAGGDALHRNTTELASTTTAGDAGTALPTVAIDHDRKGITNIGKDSPLNSGASAQDLINYGIFGAKGDDANLDLTHPDNLRTDQDKIGKVSIKTAEATAAKDANFIVGADGSVTVVHNPDNNKNTQLIVALDKVSGNEPEAQKKAADALVAYLESHYGVKGNTIDDPEHLISDKLKAETSDDNQLTRAQKDAMAAAWGNTAGDQPDPTFGGALPRVTGDFPHGGGAPMGGGGGSPMGGGGEYPQAQYPETANPYNRGGRSGYGGGYGGGGGYGNGFYGDTVGTGHGLTNFSNDSSFDFSGDLLADWLATQGIDINDPHYADKIAALAITNPALADRLGKVAHLAQDLKAGKQVSADDIKAAVPKELAQKISSAEVEKFSNQLKGADGQVDAGRLGLALKLGHVASAAEEAEPANQQLMQNARVPETNQRLLSAAQSTNGQPLWEGTGAPPNLGCAVTVSKWCRAAGYTDINASSTTDLERQLRAHGAIDIDPTNAKKGDVVMFDDGGGGHGHTAVYAGNGRGWANSSKDGVVENNTLEAMADGRHIHFLRLPSHHNTDNIATGTNKSEKPS